MATSYYQILNRNGAGDQTEEQPRRQQRRVDYLGFARRLTELRRDPKSTLRQMTRQRYVQFCNIFASVFTEMDIDFDARTFQEACNVVGETPYVGTPIPVKSWQEAVKLCEMRREAVLVGIGKNVAKVFPQWTRELRRLK